MSDERLPDDADRAGDDPAEHDGAGGEAGERDDVPYAAAEQAMAEARQRLASVPAQVVVVNHAMGIYELAAIHLSSQPPRLDEAKLAIDALGHLVDGLGERLGEESAVLRDALSNIRLAFVAVGNSAGAGGSPAASDPA